MNLQKLVTFISILLLSVVIIGCSSPTSSSESTEGEITIATSFYATHEIVEAIVQDRASTQLMIPRGRDPHSYEPTPRLLQELSRADVFVTMGGMFESVEQALLNVNSNLIVIDSTHNINMIEGHSHDHDDHSHNGHIHDSHNYDDEHSHNDEHHNEHEHNQNSHSYENHQVEKIKVEYHESKFEIEYRLDLLLPTPCYSIRHEVRYEGNKVILNVFFVEPEQNTVCIQVIEEVHYEGEITIDEEFRSEADEFIINLNSERIFKAHLHELKDSQSHDHHDEHHDEHSHNDSHDHSHGHSHDHGEFDPHVWLSINNMISMTQRIVDKLVEAYSEFEEEFRANAQEYISTLEELQNEFISTLSMCENDIIIVNHKAFGYLGYEFGFEQVSVAGFSPESEPSVQTVQRVIDTARENNLRFVFSEGQFDSQMAQTIAQDLEGEVLELNPLLQERHANYIELMQENLEQLSIGLECN
ncbi:MAG: metal ABC transporter substrate-binding protein [Candidatus Woesearchaeota archaeon]